jgi:predicted aminopeptidase
LVLLLTLGACASPGYYLQAAAGQYRLMADREELAVLLEEEPPSSPWVERLRVAADVLDFAERQLDLPPGKAYSQFTATGREAVVWNVVTTPEFSLQPRRWCFLIAGCVPYRGYFEQERARAFAEKMARRGRDVTVSPAAAYSTLGWFGDPLLDTMLAKSDARLAGTLIHELAHLRLYLPGDARFSESYATFVEQQGVARWLSAGGRADELRHWREERAASDAFIGLLRTTQTELTELYASDRPESELRASKRAAFERLRERHDRMVTERFEGRFDFSGWFSPPPNNADLALVGQYVGGVCAFASLFAAAEEDFARFHQLAAERAKLEPGARRAWLDQPCTAAGAPSADRVTSVIASPR